MGQREYNTGSRTFIVRPSDDYYDAYDDVGESAVDVVITPGRQYKVAGFPLTESVEEAIRLIRILKPQLVIPIQLTHLETTG